MVIAFPNIQPPAYPWGEQREDNVLRSPFEDGSVQSRLRYSKGRKSYDIVWNAMPDGDYDKLEAFLDEIKNGALPFSFVRPATKTRPATTLTLQLTATPKAIQNTYGLWNVTMSVKEV